MKKLKLSKGAKKQKIKEMLDKGFSYREIAEKITVGFNKIQEIAKEQKKEKEQEQSLLELQTKEEEAKIKALEAFEENKEDFTNLGNALVSLEEKEKQAQDLVLDLEKIKQELLSKALKKELAEVYTDATLLELTRDYFNKSYSSFSEEEKKEIFGRIAIARMGKK